MRPKIATTVSVEVQIIGATIVNKFVVSVVVIIVIIVFIVVIVVVHFQLLLLLIVSRHKYQVTVIPGQNTVPNNLGRMGESSNNAVSTGVNDVTETRAKSKIRHTNFTSSQTNVADVCRKIMHIKAVI
jgi:hypothetical protein